MNLNNRNHDQLRGQLEAYSLGALEAEEAAAVARHLTGCADCRRVLDDYAETIAALPHALAGVSRLRPAPAVKERLLQSIEATTLSEDPLPVATWRAGGLLRSMRPRTIAAVAAGLLMALSLAWNIGASVALARERALRAEFASLVDQQEIVLEVVDGRNTVKAPLRATESGSTSYGKLYTRPDLPHVVAMAGRLPPPVEGEAYHLWLTSQGQTRLGGLLTVNEQGFGLLVFDADHNGPVYESAQVTLQPVGSAAPSSPVLLWEAPN